MSKFKDYVVRAGDFLIGRTDRGPSAEEIAKGMEEVPERTMTLPVDFARTMRKIYEAGGGKNE
jgi:hypothetical protein